MTHVNTHKFLKDVAVNMKRSAAFIQSIPPDKGGVGGGGWGGGAEGSKNIALGARL